MLGLAEHVILCPFQRFLVTGGTHEDVTARCQYFLHSDLTIVGFELRQFLKAQGNGNLITSCRTYQTVYLVEVESRQLIDDDRDRDVTLAVHTGHKTVQDQGVQ